MLLSHRIAIISTASQSAYFSMAAGASRFVYNWALEEWCGQYALGGRPKASSLKVLFNSVKYARFPWLKNIHRDAHSQPFHDLGRAFSVFFKGGPHPSFKKKHKTRDSFYIANDRVKIHGKIATLPVVGVVKLTEALRFNGKIHSAMVIRDINTWFLSITVDVPCLGRSQREDAVGVDLGLTTFATLSTGEKIHSPKPLRRAAMALSRIARRMSRKQRGSRNRHKARIALAKAHKAVKAIRGDFLHKLTTRLAMTFKHIYIEDLNIAGLVKNHNLAFHISDAGWGEFRRQLSYKTILYGSQLTIRDRFFPSSKLCSNCGVKHLILPLGVRSWECNSCGVSHDRDINAAKNLVIHTLAWAPREVTPVEIAALVI